ncbi:PH domain-containing protein [Leucobacter denitrificans]|uniref:PH domain-containing protein n=1 Tax=Leucobacter denitrificans TaxID=683042 RepID=A0A7G9S775_9MICO|nr:PH domain-containing protein [Leucobacter denitrificans]QNN63700.1 PH domain-containing protein [Leucobacter denitrificans]
MWGRSSSRRANDETTVLPSSESHLPRGAGAGSGAGAPGSAPDPLGLGPQASVAAAPSAPSASGQPPEVIVVRVRRHGRHLTFPVLALLVIFAASGYFIGTFPEPWMNLLAAGAAGALAIVLGILPILAWLSRRAVITSRRAIVHHGFFVRHRSEVSLARVREVRSKQNPIQRMFGSGDIDLFVGAEATRITDAPGVKDLHAAIQELSERSYDEQIRSTGFGF